MRKSIVKTLKTKKILLKDRGVNRGHSNTNNAKTTAVALVLTPLVDAFAILVIYLLVSTTQQANNIKIEHQIKLPQAGQTQDIQNGIVLTIKNGEYLLDDNAVRPRRLARALTKKLKDNTKMELIIEADERINFKLLSPIMIASSEAGISKIKFAVIKGAKL